MNMPLVLLNRRRRGGFFSPYSLFSGTAIGIWLDPSDLSTMYQDAAGTTAVTTPGQPVGLRLDKSKGLALGADVVGGVWSGTGNAQDGTVFSGDDLEYWATEFPTVIGRSYRFTATLSGKVNNSQIRFRAGISGTGTALYSSNNDALPLTVNILVVATSTTSNIEILFRSASASVTLSNISVRELAGNHATQSTLGSRPMYGIEPAGGRRNLLTYSEDLSNAAWSLVRGGTVSTPVRTLNFAEAPDGTTTATRLQITAGAAATNADFGLLRNTFTYPTNTQFNSSLWVRSNTGSNQLVSLRYNEAASAVVTVTTAWQRLSVNGATATAAFDVGLRGDTTAKSDIDILIWRPQAETGTAATAYQRVTSAFDVTEAGVQSCHYVQYDGSDDGMITNSIDFTATDKMSVFAGVRKLSDAASGVIVETSTAAGAANPGSFNIVGPNSAAATNYGFRSGGTVSIGINSGGGAYAAPVTNVLSMLASTAGDTLVARIDGAQVNSSTADQGTGNYGNYPLYLGRRGGASLPFNGRDYGILVVGKATTAEEIASTEKWLASKTGVTI